MPAPPQAALLLCLVVAAALLPRPATALSTWSLGLSAQTGYNSQVVQPVLSIVNGMPVIPTSDAWTLTINPYAQLQTDTGRISELLRYQFIFDGFLLLHANDQTAYSYQNVLTSTTKIDLTARLSWTAGVSVTQGEINSFSQGQDPATETIQGINLVGTDFLSISLTSLLLWEPSARIKITQPIHFLSYIPYGTIDIRTTMPGGMVVDTTQDVTSALQSYSLDGGVGVDYLWARVSLGSELLIGWFLPQGGLDQLPGSGSGSVVTAQLIVRSVADLTPRWHLEASLGAFVATLADHFFVGQYQNGTGAAALTESATLVSPVGKAEVRYQFPGVGAGAGLTYQHAASGEVFLGGLTISDSVTLRAYLPLPKNLLLSASAGYRHSVLAGNGGFSSLASPGQNTYDLWQADAAVGWIAKPWLTVYGRYAFLYQIPSGTPVASDEQLLSFDRHLITVGVTFTYPPK